MLRRGTKLVRTQGGDTLIEVTLALAILGMVLLACTAIAASAFRMGQTARERTEVSTEAQRQMEELRSFRDNHTWAEFRNGVSGTYPGIDNVVTAPCKFDSSRACFHMELQPTTAGTQEYVPATGSTNANVPTSVIELSTNTPAAARGCGYDFELHYSFSTLGGGNVGDIDASNQIATRLVNLHYAAPSGGICP